MNLFKNLKLYYKVFSLILLALTMLIMVALVGYTYTNKMADSAQRMYTVNTIPIASINNIRYNMRTGAAYLLELTISTDEARKKQLSDNIAKINDSNQQEMNNLENVDFNADQQELFKKFKDQFADYAIVRDKAIDLATQNEGDKAYNLYLTDVRQKMNATFDAINTLSDNALSAAADKSKSNQKDSTTANIILIVAALIAALILTAVGIAITNMITRPVKKLQELMGRAEKGDLTVQGDYHAKDEIGQLNRSFNGMLTSFKETVTKVLIAAESVSASAQEISASTEEIASGSTEQAKSAQAMNELFGELAEAVNSVAQSAENAADLSNKTMDVAREGGAVVKKSIEGMDRLSGQMAKLENDSNQIGDIIEVIDDIAEQTNLLALNAAIEAARAGDQGRGFAVVADEVRKLAERSGEATKQITAIIKGMQQNTLQSVKAVEDGVASSQQTGAAFENILAMVNESGMKVAEIAAASEQQSAQTTEVLHSIETISSATEEASASSEETAAAAQSLAGLAEELNTTVSVFRIK